MYVKANEIVLVFVVSGFKPLHHGCSVFPLIGSFTVYKDGSEYSFIKIP